MAQGTVAPPMLVGRPRARRFRPALLLGLGVVIALVGTGVFVATLRAGQGAVGRAQIAQDSPVTAMDLGLRPANNSPALLVDPTESRFVVLANRLDAPDFGCALQVSGDAGRSWVTASPVPALPAGADKCYAPEVAFDRHGVLYYLFVGLAGRGNEPMGAFLTTSSDRAQTFSAPQRVLGPLNFGVRMALDPAMGEKGRLHLAWLHATSDPPAGGFGPSPNPIMAAHSDDGGRTFSKPVQVSDAARKRVVAPALALGSDHAVHVAYYDLEDDARDYQGLEGPTWEGTWSVVVARSSDAGRRFGAGVVVDEAVAPAERVLLVFTMPPPSLVAQGARVCAAWTDARNGDADALARCSATRGRTWEGLRRLNDDPVRNGRSQYLPRLGMSPDGRLDAVFFDRRQDPQNIRHDVFYTFSVDGGWRFSPNLKLTHEASDSRAGQRYASVLALGRYDLGARLALLSQGGRAMAAWPDTRNVGGGTTEQDLFATAVRLSGARRQSGVARAVSALLLVSGAVTVLIALRRRDRTSGAAPAHGQDG